MVLLSEHIVALFEVAPSDLTASLVVDRNRHEHTYCILTANFGLTKEVDKN